MRDLLTGFPTARGRHGGCRLLITRDGSLLVGTGDAARRHQPAQPELARRQDAAARPGHRRAVAEQPVPRRRATATSATSTPTATATCRASPSARDGTLWSVEQGTYRDDEVNRLRNGGDYGYNPVPGYNETVPMTDQSLPGRQIEARWRSGNPTLATSGGTWVHGKQWGALTARSPSPRSRRSGWSS